jgi:hypothetical protein
VLDEESEGMNVYGRGAVSDFLGEMVVYRNLVPVDPRVPPLAAICEKLGIPSGRIPRKSELDYARVIVHMLEAARALDAPGQTLERLVYIGDTRLNDGTAFENLCAAGEWAGLAFIGSETADPPASEVLPRSERRCIFLANRWGALYDFDRFRHNEGFFMDARTAVVVDLDKTALGARGRNAQVIDQARVTAVKETVAGLLGAGFNEAGFQGAYDRLNQVEFHPFTGDNQDYLAYISLILGSGLFDLDDVIADVHAGLLSHFQGFIQQVDSQVDDLSPALSTIHREILANVQAGDPTPFKAFRRREYLATVSRMGHLPDDASVDDILSQEIAITKEVWTLAQNWQEEGALLLGLSDKPDEASLPTEQLAGEGHLPIHQTLTHIIGE